MISSNFTELISLFLLCIVYIFLSINTRTFTERSVWRVFFLFQTSCTDTTSRSTASPRKWRSSTPANARWVLLLLSACLRPLLYCHLRKISLFANSTDEQQLSLLQLMSPLSTLRLVFWKCAVKYDCDDVCQEEGKQKSCWLLLFHQSWTFHLSFFKGYIELFLDNRYCLRNFIIFSGNKVCYLYFFSVVSINSTPEARRSPIPIQTWHK